MSTKIKFLAMERSKKINAEMWAAIALFLFLFIIVEFIFNVLLG